jgi:voltage-gated potassium channel
MPEQFQIPILKVPIGRFLFLLISIILWFVLRPFLEGLAHLSTLVDLFVTLILLAGVFALIQNRGVFIFGLNFAFITLVIRWMHHLMNISSLDVISQILSILFMGFIVGIILSYLFREDEITSDVIMAAICGYFLIGLLWNSVYLLLFAFEPGSFQFSRALGSGVGDFTYYSFVTLTTLGYGDITPGTTPARSLALLEAVMGQLYLAILVARLVGIHIAQSHEKKRGPTSG